VAKRSEIEGLLREGGGKVEAVDVRWPSFDSAGAERALGADGEPRIRVALTRTT
jgi:hypothetical protein